MHFWSNFDPNFPPEDSRNKKKPFLLNFASISTKWTNTVLVSERDKFLWYEISAKFFQICSSKQGDFSESIFGNAAPKSTIK